VESNEASARNANVVAIEPEQTDPVVIVFRTKRRCEGTSGPHVR
jgi:hypothetical protein